MNKMKSAQHVNQEEGSNISGMCLHPHVAESIYIWSSFNLEWK